MDFDEFLDDVLVQVERPARYIGGEVNSSRGSAGGVGVRVVLAYPDLYEIGASNLGLQILYELVNARDDALAERVYLPWTDMQERMRARGVPLFSLESRQRVAGFDILGITLQHELTYTNVVRLLDLAGIQRRAADRGEGDILIVGGGPGAFNAEPVAELFDLLVIGDGEEAIQDLVDLVGRSKARGLRRRALLEEAAGIEGFYVPSLYTPVYEEDGRLAGLDPQPGAPLRIRKRCVHDLDRYTLPARPIVPFLETVHDRANLEVFRGCTRGCRFCQAGYIYRPVRERSEAVLQSWAEELMRATGYGELSLSSLSTADYSRILTLAPHLRDALAGERMSISFPSLRCDADSVELAALTRSARRSGLTFAPEAGSQRLRDRINKGVSETDIFTAVGRAYERGWRRIKLYFMIGLPGEDEEDVLEIARLSKRLLRGDIGKTLGGLQLVVSVSSFVPKPHTPYQWCAQDSMGTLAGKQELLFRELKGKNLSFRWHSAPASYLEGLLARGDRRLLPAIEEASAAGCFDNWSESFDWAHWVSAMRNLAPGPEFYIERERGRDEVFPWDHIDCGVDRAYLREEYERGAAGLATADCRFEGCTDCGACPGGTSMSRAGLCVAGGRV